MCFRNRMMISPYGPKTDLIHRRTLVPRATKGPTLVVLMNFLFKFHLMFCVLRNNLGGKIRGKTSSDASTAMVQSA